MTCIVHADPRVQAIAATVFDATTAVVGCVAGRIKTVLWKGTSSDSQTSNTCSYQKGSNALSRLDLGKGLKLIDKSRM
ncbi:hypothetical protein DPMN_104086 [Dreissena polymorpha]|uniref:Uncharacterized protein n=1 Tax=Dreissena polymorpha TaxID=45954 RepID=A0A9D4HCB9_DREPO|nr:hypothetical protein DPMN_104086 [Dreissena polymorpha]